MNRLLAAGAVLAATLIGVSRADAATFVFNASANDAQNGEPIAYDAVLTTDDGVAGAGGTVYTVLSGTGTGGGFDITEAGGSFRLAGGVPSLVDVRFIMQGPASDLWGGVSVDGAGNRNLYFSEGGGRLASLTITPQVTAGVPEPATWAMMIAGFGLVGGALRRRRATVVFA